MNVYGLSGVWEDWFCFPICEEKKVAHGRNDYSLTRWFLEIKGGGIRGRML